MDREENRVYFHVMTKESPIQLETIKTIEQRLYELSADIKVESTSLASVGALYASAEKDVYKTNFVKQERHQEFDQRYASDPLFQYFFSKAEVPSTLSDLVDEIEMEGTMGISKKKK